MQLSKYMMCKIELKGDLVGFNSMATLCQNLSIGFFCHHLQKAIFHSGCFQKCGTYMVSDFLPFDGDLYYIPKPETITPGLKTITITEQKALRTIRYIPVNDLNAYLDGQYDYLGASKNFFGKIVARDRQTAFRPDDGNGIYFIFHCNSQAFFDLFDDKVDEYLSGIPGLNYSKVWQSLPGFYSDALHNNAQHRLSLSSLQSDIDKQVLEQVCDNATFAVQERTVLRINAATVFEKSICIIPSGACVSHEGLCSYNESIPDQWGKNISIGICKEVK